MNPSNKGELAQATKNAGATGANNEKRGPIEANGRTVGKGKVALLRVRRGYDEPGSTRLW